MTEQLLLTTYDDTIRRANFKARRRVRSWSARVPHDDSLQRAREFVLLHLRGSTEVENPFGMVYRVAYRGALRELFESRPRRDSYPHDYDDDGEMINEPADLLPLAPEIMQQAQATAALRQALGHMRARATKPEQLAAIDRLAAGAETARNDDADAGRQRRAEVALLAELREHLAEHGEPRAPKPTQLGRHTRKLNDGAVRDIRERTGKVTQRQLAREHGVTVETVRSVQTRRTYREVA